MAEHRLGPSLQALIQASIFSSVEFVNYGRWENEGNGTGPRKRQPVNFGKEPEVQEHVSIGRQIYHVQFAVRSLFARSKLSELCASPKALVTNPVEVGHRRVRLVHKPVIQLSSGRKRPHPRTESRSEIVAALSYFTVRSVDPVEDCGAFLLRARDRDLAHAGPGLSSSIPRPALPSKVPSHASSVSRLRRLAGWSPLFSSVALAAAHVRRMDQTPARARRRRRVRAYHHSAEREHAGERKQHHTRAGCVCVCVPVPPDVPFVPPACLLRPNPNRSSSPAMNTYSTGVMNRFRIVERIIPPNTAVPSELRAPLPAPVAKTSGVTPRTNAIEVMRIGRSRVSAARITAVTVSTPCSRSWFENSTIRIAFFDASPISITYPTCANTSENACRTKRPPIAPSSASGTASRMISGSANDSYCAESTRNTKMIPRPKMIAACEPPSICSREIPLHSVAKPGGRFAAKRSIVASASPEP